MLDRPPSLVVLGIYAADLTLLTPRLPAWGETVLGSAARLGPGGKGSNQAVAAARLGARVALLAKLGADPFAAAARALYAAEGVETEFVFETTTAATGTAAILVDAARGENAIVVVPGAAAALGAEEIALAEGRIAAADGFLTQLELPTALVADGLARASRHGVRTLLNPAPAAPLEDTLLGMVDVLTPNESEAETLTGIAIDGPEAAARAAAALAARGVGAVVITLGPRGALAFAEGTARLVPAHQAGAVVDTTGAGDCFSAALAVALAEGQPLAAAAAFACRAAGIQVTRPGTAPAMPYRREVTPPAPARSSPPRA